MSGARNEASRVRLPALTGFLVLGCLTVSPTVGASSFECGFRPAEEWIAAFQEAARRGEIADPRTRFIPSIPPAPPRRSGRSATVLGHDDIFPFEDTSGLLLSDFSDEQLFELMIVAANELMSVRGDNYDFVGFWLNFAPHHEIGAAFHLSFENDVSGIGADLYQLRAESGLGGDRIEGMVMMWNINSAQWQAGSGPGADYTRLVLSHEFEHRFGVFLPPLADGRRLQGGCSEGSFHWNSKIDAQGSAMDLSEWIGESPASLATSFGFNLDIPGGAYSYADLYLMGYVSPGEMDSGLSELRFMNGWNCFGQLYFGTISEFSSAEIIAVAGPRIPDSSSEDTDYRTGWIMMHRPGDPPDTGELDKAIGILEQNTIDWGVSTLGRGSIDHSLEDAVIAPDSFGSPAGEVRLEAASPNPFSSATVLGFLLPRTARATVTIHDVTGRRVLTLLDGTRSAGRHSPQWDGRDDLGRFVATGTYFVRLHAAGYVDTERVVFLRGE